MGGALNILIADDERLARKRLRLLVEELGDSYTVLGEAESGADVLRRCRELMIDVVLLDIRMPDMDGLEAAAALAELAVPPAVIFVSAFDEFALAAFERHGQDYLLKPVRRERLEQALKRSATVSRAQLGSLARLDSATANRRRHFSAMFRGTLLRVAVEDVLFLRAEQKYVLVRHVHGELLLEEALRALEEEFRDVFLRVHRNALVAKNRLEALEKDSTGQCWVRVSGCEERLSVSRRHLPEVRRWLRNGIA